MSIDIVDLAATKQIDEAILVTGDSDFIPAVERAKQHGVNITLYHSKERKSYHDDLWERCDDRIAIDKDLVDKIKKS